MGFDPNEPEQRRRLRAAMKAADIPLSELWLKYFSLSGDAGEYEVEAYLQGLLSLPAIQRDLLALAANELIDDLPRPRAPYSDDFAPEPAGQDAATDAPGSTEPREGFPPGKSVRPESTPGPDGSTGPNGSTGPDGSGGLNDGEEGLEPAPEG